MKFPSSPAFQRTLALAVSALMLAGCGRGDSGSAHSGLSFPADSAIAEALRQDFAQNPGNAQARTLIATLGGEKGELGYKIHRVVYRQGAFEAQYDVSLHMARPGAESLQKLYAGMIPEDLRAKLPEQTLPAYEKWLGEQATAVEKSDPAQAAGLRRTLASLGECYRNAKAGDDVLLMEGLSALVSPAREGWYAEKMESARLQLRCLPL
ncbi:hypothetical protein AAFF27_05990 [Xylophilus sp. GW821-FHT01B05]